MARETERRRPLDALDRHALRRWALRARAGLAERREEIDALNVFPVPDGDTGTNMFLTLDTAVERSAQVGPEEDLATFARATVLGARGNSGVILSQLVRGLLDVARGPAEDGRADAGVVAQAMRRASDLAYACVGEPKEGTILTVARSAAEAAEARARQAQASLSAVVDAALAAARDALERTPTQLAALRQAGVVDAGASGLVTVLDALKRVVDGTDGGEPPVQDGQPLGVPEGEVVPPDYDGPRFEVIHLLHGADAPSLDDLRTALAELGDSVVVAAEGDLARVHAHVDDPDEAVRRAARLGRVEGVVVTDLHAQAAGARAAEAARWVAPDTGLPEVEGPLVLACTDGEGLRGLFTAEGAVVVTSGPGARATVGAIIETVRTHPRRPVLVLPNDADVVLTAHTAAAELARSGREVLVLPTRSDLEGLAALAVLDRTAPVADSLEEMAEATAAMRSGAVARASRDAETPVGPCRAGDVIGIDGDQIVVVGDDPGDVTDRLVDRMLRDGGERVSVLTGDVPAAVVDAVAARCAAQHPEVEVLVHDGGQSAYLLLVGVE